MGKLFAHGAFYIVAQDVPCKRQHFREKELKVAVGIFHADNLFQQDDCIVVFLPDDQLFGKDKAVVHEFLARKPAGQAEAGAAHVHPLEFLYR